MVLVFDLGFGFDSWFSVLGSMVLDVGQQAFVLGLWPGTWVLGLVLGYDLWSWFWS